MSPEIKCGDLILKFDLEKPTESVKEKAVQELRETPENIEMGLRELKCLLEDEKDLVVPKDDDKWLMNFLRRCKYYPKSSKKLIKRYYEFRGKYPEVTEFLIPSKLKYVFDHNQVSILPQRDQFGRRIIMMIAGEKWHHKTVHRDDCFRATILCCEAVQMEPATQINGLVLIMDCKGTTLSQTMEMTPYYMRRMVDYVQSAIPLRIKGFHFINAPGICSPLFKLGKQFLTPKSRERLHLHSSNLTTLHRYISPECLPACYGGTLKSDLAYGRETYQLLAHHEEYFEKLQKYGYLKNN